MKSVIHSVIAGGLLFVSAAAQATGPLSSSMETILVNVDAEGKEQYSTAKEVSPNDLIEYRLAYQNTSESALSGIRFVGAIPASTHYVAGSANEPEAQQMRVSIDGGKTWETEPVIREVVNEFGEAEKLVIPAKEYTHISWQLEQPLVAEAVESYSYRVRVQ